MENVSSRVPLRIFFWTFTNCVTVHRGMAGRFQQPISASQDTTPCPTRHFWRRQMIPGQSFHAYPLSGGQAIAAYSRNEPLHCDTAEHDTTGAFSLWTGAYTTGCFIAPVACVMQFHAMVLINMPPRDACANVWLMKNLLPTVAGAIGGECCGDDVPTYQAPTYGYNTTARVSRIMKLVAGDHVWAVPGISCGGSITNSVAANGFNTVNYFEGVCLSV